MFFSYHKLFIEIAKSKNISQAAIACNISQPAASIKLKSLENFYGVILFDRNNRFELTDAGKSFLTVAKKMISMEYKFKDDIKRVFRDEEHILKFGATTGPGNYILPEIISHFHELNPDVYIQMSIGRKHNILEDVKNHYLNFAFVGSKGEQRLKYEPLIYDRIILCGSGRKKWPDQILKKDIQLYELFFEQKGSSSRQVIEKWLEDNDINILELKCIGEIGLPDALKKVVQYSKGIAFLPEILIRQELENGLLKEIVISDIPQLERPLYLATNRNYHLTDVALNFVDYYLKRIKFE